MFNKIINTHADSLRHYSHILSINDSLVLPIHGIENMSKTIIQHESRSDFWGIWKSPETKEHIMSSFLQFNSKMLLQLSNYFKQYDLNCGGAGHNNSVQQCEINLLEHFTKLGYKHSVVVDYKTLSNINVQAPITHPNVFSQWISRPEVFAIKWKYMGNYLNKQRLNMPYLNYLLQYLHFNHTGPKGKPEELKVYENPLKYL